MIKRWFANTVLVLTLRCKGFERIESRSLDEQISWTHYLAKKGHWLACGRCRHTTHQLDAIEKAVRKLPAQDKVSMPQDVRQRIAERMRYLESSTIASENDQNE